MFCPDVKTKYKLISKFAYMESVIFYDLYKSTLFSKRRRVVRYTLYMECIITGERLMGRAPASEFFRVFGQLFGPKVYRRIILQPSGYAQTGMPH